MQSDRGSGFLSKVSQYASETLGIKWRFDTPRSPMSSGLVEQCVKKMKILANIAQLKDPKMDFFDTLPSVAYCINTNFNESLGCSAYYAMYGRNPDDVEDILPKTPLLSGDSKIFIENLQTQVENRHHLIKESRKLAQMKQKHRYDSKIVAIPSLQKGDLVMLDCVSHKLDRKNCKKGKIKREGPYRILSLESNGRNAILIDMLDNVLPNLHSVRKLHKIPNYRENFPIDLVSNFTLNDMTSDPETDNEFDYDCGTLCLENLFSDKKENSNVSNYVTVKMQVRGKQKTSGSQVLNLFSPVGYKKGSVYLPWDKVNEL